MWGGGTGEGQATGQTQPIHVLGRSPCKKMSFMVYRHPEMFGLFTFPLKGNVTLLLAHGKMTTQKGCVTHTILLYRVIQEGLSQTSWEH